MLTTKIKSSNKINSFLYESYKNKLFDTMFFALFCFFPSFTLIFYLYAFFRLLCLYRVYYEKPLVCYDVLLANTLLLAGSLGII
jgi:hypothetical protein